MIKIRKNLRKINELTIVNKTIGSNKYKEKLLINNYPKSLDEIL